MQIKFQPREVRYLIELMEKQVTTLQPSLEGQILDKLKRANYGQPLKQEAVYTTVENAKGRVPVRIGRATKKSDGSISVELDALPANGRMEIR